MKRASAFDQDRLPVTSFQLTLFSCRLRNTDVDVWDVRANNDWLRAAVNARVTGGGVRKKPQETGFFAASFFAECLQPGRDETCAFRKNKTAEGGASRLASP